MKLQRFDAPAKLKLDDIPTDPPDSVKKREARDRFEKLSSELFELQDLMWGSRTHSVLMVLQGRDAAGKDGTVKHLSGALNPRGIMVTSFGVPTTEERQHDFLWRVHKRAPRAGEVGIFNRSHYEDVLVARVKKLVPPAIWKERYDLINGFERALAAAGCIVLKFFLHITNEEQKQRLLERENIPSDAWKLSVEDWNARQVPCCARRQQRRDHAETQARAAQAGGSPGAAPADEPDARDGVVAHQQQRGCRR